MVWLRVVLGAEEKRHSNDNQRPGLGNPPEFGDHSVEIGQMLKDMAAQDFLEMGFGKWPGILIQIAQAIAAVIDAIEVQPTRANIETTTHIEATRKLNFVHFLGTMAGSRKREKESCSFLFLDSPSWLRAFACDFLLSNHEEREGFQAGEGGDP